MTFTTYQTPAPLEAYLRRATLGLPPERREEVWNELEEHVLNRVEQLEFQGHPPEEALEQALRELGPPLRVSAAMNGVHNMPKLIAFATLTTLAVSAGLYAFAGGGGKVMTLPVITQGPAQKCIEAARKDQPQLPVVSRDQHFICYQPGDARHDGAYLSMTTAKRAIEALGGTLSVHSDGRYRLEGPNGWTSFAPVFREANDYYVPAANFLGTLLRTQSIHSEKQIILRHYRNPELSFGGLTLKLSQPVNEPIGQHIYSSVGDLLMSQLVYADADEGFQYEAYYNTAGDVPHTISTGLKPDEAVFVLARLGDNTFKVVTRPVGPNGKVSFFYLPGELRFVTSAKELTPPQAGQPPPVMLVRLTNVPLNNLRTGIFLPK